MTDNRTVELVGHEAKVLLEGFLCKYQNILLSRGISTNEAVCKQNELIDEYAKRIEQIIAATLENDPYDAVSSEHVISPNILHLILDEWDVHPGWTATNENMAQLFSYVSTCKSDRVTETSIDKWLREFQLAHGELAHIGPDELKDLACALYNDIPLGYEASRRLSQWLLYATLDNKICKQVLVDCYDGLMPPFMAHCSACGVTWGFTPKFCPECGARVIGTRNEWRAVK